MLILFQIGKSLDNMIQFIVFSAIDLALEYIDVINSIRNSSPPSSLKYLRPIGTRVETGGVRILFGGKSKTIRSSSAQIHTSVDNTLAHTVLGWALWCWEALYGNVVVAWLKYCYTQVQSLDALSTLLSGLRRWSDQLKANEICRRVIFRPIALVYGAAKFTIGKILSLLMKLVLMLAIVSVSITSFLKNFLASNEVMEEFAQPVGPKIDATVGDKKSTSDSKSQMSIDVLFAGRKSTFHVRDLEELKSRVKEWVGRKGVLHFYLAPHSGRRKFDLVDKMTLNVNAFGRGGMPDRQGSVTQSPENLAKLRNSLELEETPDSKERIPGLESSPQKKETVQDVRKSMALTRAPSTVAGDRERVRFFDVTGLEGELQQKNDELEEARAEIRRLKEQQMKTKDFFDELKKDRLHRANEKSESKRKGSLATEQVQRKPAARRLSLSPNAKDEDDSESDGEENDQNEKVEQEPVFLGQNPPNLEKIADVSTKSLTERLIILEKWIQKLKAWIENTTENGEIIFEMLIQSADTYCHHWLLESGNPVRGRSFGLEAIACEGDHVPWRQYLTRAYSRIYPSLSQDLITEHLEDVAECSLNAFQKVCAVLIAAMTNYGVKNLDEQKKLVSSLYRPVDWLTGKIDGAPIGWRSCGVYTHPEACKLAPEGHQRRERLAALGREGSCRAHDGCKHSDRKG